MQKTSKTHKALAILSLFVGISVMGFAISLAEGWTPFPSANATEVHELAGLSIPDAPVNIETDAEFAPERIQVAEVVIIATPAKKPVAARPGAARRMPVDASEAPQLVSPGRLTSPTGIASDAALSYRPSFGHGVRGPRLEMRPEAFSNPRRNTKQERETFVFDGN